MRLAALTASLATFALSITSTTFVLLALTSKNWSIQKYYDAAIGGGSPTTWTDPPLCSASRSPFYRCGIPSVTVDNTTTCIVPDCAFFKSYGWNATSCRSPLETGSDDFFLNSGAQECQEGK